jgi:hypothetical protein
MKFRDYRKPKSRADSVYARISKFNFTSVPLKINKNNIFLQKYFAIQKKALP